MFQLCCVYTIFFKACFYQFERKWVNDTASVGFVLAPCICRKVRVVCVIKPCLQKTFG